jgi:hypothetical protein
LYAIATALAAERKKREDDPITCTPTPDCRYTELVPPDISQQPAKVLKKATLTNRRCTRSKTSVRKAVPPTAGLQKASKRLKERHTVIR